MVAPTISFVLLPSQLVQNHPILSGRVGEVSVDPNIECGNLIKDLTVHQMGLPKKVPKPARKNVMVSGLDHIRMEWVRDLLLFYSDGIVVRSTSIQLPSTGAGVFSVTPKLTSLTRFP